MVINIADFFGAYWASMKLMRTLCNDAMVLSAKMLKDSVKS